MATNINRGNQQLVFDYKHPVKGRDFNRLLFSIVKPGIYRGLDVTIDTENKINISPGFAFLNCMFESELVRGTLVRFQTSIVGLEIPQSLPNTNERVYLIFEYKEVTENWVDIRHTSVGALLPSEAVVLCDLEYNNAGNIIAVHSESKQLGLFDSSYNIPDIQWFANALDNSKRFRFDSSKNSANTDIVLEIPDYNFNLASIESWMPNRNYKTKEVVIQNKSLYRCLSNHTSSSNFLSDIGNWENIIHVQEQEIVRGFAIPSIPIRKIVRATGYNTTQQLPEIEPINAINQRPFGVAIDSIPGNTIGLLIQRGVFTFHGWDTTSIPVGTKVYSDSNGNPTTTPTTMPVGHLLVPGNDSVVYLSIVPSKEGLDTSNFNNQLSMLEDTVQKAFDRLEDFGFVGVWTSGVDYRIGNVVIDSNDFSIWRCNANHTSSTNWNSDRNSYWDPITDFTAFKKADAKDLVSSSSNIVITNGNDSVLKPVTISLNTNDITTNDSNISIVGGYNSVLNDVSISLNKEDLITTNSNIIITNGDDSVLNNVILDFSNNPIFDSVEIQELLLGYSITIDGLNSPIHNLDASNHTHVRVTNTNEITGIVSPSNRKILILTNIHTNEINIVNESNSSLASNRIITGIDDDLTIPQNSSVCLLYDIDSSRWRIIGGSGGNGSFSFKVNQSNTFQKGEPIYYNTNTNQWELAIANSTNTLTQAVVVSANSNSFKASNVGILKLTSSEITNITGSSSFTIGQVYYLSSSNAGKYVTSPPLNENAVLLGISSNTVLLFSQGKGGVSNNKAIVPLNNNSSIRVANLFLINGDGKYIVMVEDNTHTFGEFYFESNPNETCMIANGSNDFVPIDQNNSLCLIMNTNNEAILLNRLGRNVNLVVYRWLV